MSQPLIEVLIPTLNEAGQIAETVANAIRLGPVFVVDSQSTDETRRLAQEAGATVIEHPFEGYATQKNWALDNAPFKGRWVFVMDADERITPQLRDELHKAVQADQDVDAYQVNRLMIFMGREIKHGGFYPDQSLRLLKRGRCRFGDRLVHEKAVCSGKTGWLAHPLLHIRQETLSEYLNKQIHYAELESRELIKQVPPPQAPARAPFQPLWTFLSIYALRLGFLDGRAGLHLAMLTANYEHMVGLLYREKLNELPRDDDSTAQPPPEQTQTLPISILILTLNEESNLPECLESIRWCDDVVVFDSYSTDRTVELAQAAGARVVQRRFDNWSAHQNWAMENIEFKHKWVFYLDADERMTPQVKAEIASAANDPAETRVAFYCGRRNYFMGKWLKHAMPPGMVMRFFIPSKIRFERLVNPTPVIDGNYGYLRQYFDHYSFGKGITAWVDKHNKYSQLEAIEGMKLLKGQHGPQPSLWDHDPAVRRKALKNLSFSMPLRPLLKFCYIYFIKLGFLDGRAGLTYCTLQTIYEYMITIKMKELKRREKNLPI